MDEARSGRNEELRPQERAHTDRYESTHAVRAEGYGLTEEQQRAFAEIEAWQRKSLRSQLMIGGPAC